MNHCYFHARKSHKNWIGRVGETSCCTLLPMSCHVHALQGNKIRRELFHIIITVTSIVTAVFITADIVAWINCSIVHVVSFMPYRFSVSPCMLMATSLIIFSHTLITSYTIFPVFLQMYLLLFGGFLHNLLVNLMPGCLSGIPVADKVAYELLYGHAHACISVVQCLLGADLFN